MPTAQVYWERVHQNVCVECSETPAFSRGRTLRRCRPCQDRRNEHSAEIRKSIQQENETFIVIPTSPVTFQPPDYTDRYLAIRKAIANQAVAAASSSSSLSSEPVSANCISVGLSGSVGAS